MGIIFEKINEEMKKIQRKFNKNDLKPKKCK